VSLCAGTDPVTKDRMYLRETVPAGPNAEAKAGRILAGFIHEVNERRHPRTDATVRQLIERHLADAKLGINYSRRSLAIFGPIASAGSTGA
jgi:hypothetical protein